MTNLFTVPGFLGLPSDWELIAPTPLFSKVSITDYSLESLPIWANQFNNKIKETTSQASILMGYSLGGRLALHALIDNPQQWKAAIIISAHTGLKTNEERQLRLEKDKRWTDRFLHEKWSPLINSWNDQEVFKQDSFHFEREETYYNRQQLATILHNFSLGMQQDLQKKLESLFIPILWLTGEKDERYCALAQTVQLTHPLSKKIAIENGGHRFPWSHPQDFLNTLDNFLNQL